jgi:hypothetical protein
MQNNLDAESQTRKKEYIHAVTFLPLKGWRYMIPFQLMTSNKAGKTKPRDG